MRGMERRRSIALRLTASSNWSAINRIDGILTGVWLRTILGSETSRQGTTFRCARPRLGSNQQPGTYEEPALSS